MSDRLKIKNANLSFPNLFQKSMINGQQTKFGCTLLLDKDKDAKQIEHINKKIDEYIASVFPNGAPKSLKKSLIKDGDTCDYDGYENKIAYRFTNSKRPSTFDRDRSNVVEEDNLFYAGCVVNASVGFWYSDHPTGGKQIIGNLFGVQFVKDGEAFGGNHVASVDDFDDIEDDEMFG